MGRRSIMLPYLLSLLAILMGAHMSLLLFRYSQCRGYEQVLLQRLSEAAPNSQPARDIRNEIQNYFSGRYSDCSTTTEAFAVVADKYLAVILSLLTGAGVASGVMLKQKMDEDKPPPPET